MAKGVTDEELRAQIAARLEAEIRPMLNRRKYDEEGGYDCCGCSTYDMILNHAIAIVKGEDFKGGYVGQVFG